VLATDAIAFAGAVSRLLSEPAESGRVAGNGRHTFERHYTWEAAWRTLDANPQVTCARELNRYTG
jgi:hypothetical protein